MAHNTEPKWRQITVRPSRRFIDEWDFHTVKALATRSEQIERQVSEWSSVTSQQQLEVIEEHLAIQGLLSQLKSGETPEIN